MHRCVSEEMRDVLMCACVLMCDMMIIMHVKVIATPSPHSPLLPNIPHGKEVWRECGRDNWL